MTHDKSTATSIAPSLLDRSSSLARRWTARSAPPGLEPASDESTADRLYRYLNLRKAGVYYALIGIIVVFGTSTSVTDKPNYITLANAGNVLQQASIPGVLVVFTSIVLITGNFDLSIASTAGLSTALALRLIDVVNPVLVIALCLAVGAMVGVVNGFLVVYRRINAFIVTLATLTIVRGLVYVASGETSVVANAIPLRPLSTGVVSVDVAWLLVAFGLALALWSVRKLPEEPVRPFAVAGIGIGVVGAVAGGVFAHGQLALNHSVLITLGIGLAAWFVMRYTVLGRRLYAVGSNAEAAQLAGVPVKRYQFGAFVVNGGAAAFTGLMLAGLYQAADPSIFTGQELIMITAAVIGGTSLFGGSGDVLKALLGMVILAAITNGMNFQALSAAWQSAVQGGILILAAAVYTAQGTGRHRRVMDREQRKEEG